MEFKLPTSIEKGDGTLSLAITDGGVVEPIAKTIPILINSVDISMYPEGGDLIAGLSNRVYVEAKTPAKKPADLVGSIVDSKGTEVATIRTEHEGRGLFRFTPVAGEKYSMKLSQPAGISKTFALPDVKATGVVLQSTQDVFGKSDSIKLQLASTADGKFSVYLSQHETQVVGSEITLAAGVAKTVELLPPAGVDGVLIATVKDLTSGMPVAERLIFRAPAKALHVKVTADKSSYVPADSATITVTTTDDEGKPVAAVVGITATDDSILQMLEKRDRAPRLDSMIFLENDVKELADADVYLDPADPKAPVALDLLLGTQGWRRFATVDAAKFLATTQPADQAAVRRALADRQPPVPMVFGGAIGGGGRGGRRLGGAGGAGGPQVMLDRAEANRDGAVAEQQGQKEADDAVVDQLKAQPNAAPAPVAAPAPAPMPPVAPGAAADAAAPAAAAAALPADQLRIAGGGGGRAAGKMMMVPRRPIVQVVRIYAHDLAQNHQPGERTDFTETLYWSAGVKTDAATGKATVSFKLNDAVSSFKISADGFTDGGAVGIGTATISSVQPFYVEPKMPLEVSTGDIIHLPLAFVNGTASDMAAVQVSLLGGQGLTVSPIDEFALPAGGRVRQVTDITVGAFPHASDFIIQASAGGYSDDVTRRLVVQPVGFPTGITSGGLIDPNGNVSKEIDVPDSLVAGSMVTNIALYPTPMGNLTEALERLMQEPNGCFEQTSSTTYPLVMAQQYFQTHTGVDPAIIAKSDELLGKGYDRLLGFECSGKGYEWFGEDPGHECLSAFGLLEFTDMSAVRTVDPKMLADTRNWLMTHRDGQGGFTHERRALHTWIADPDCANSYCTWALLECGQTGLDKEVKWVKDHAATDPNSYVTALAANVMFLAGDKDSAKTFMTKLASQQDADGHVKGATTTVVGSGGDSLEIETTSLATLAWLRDPAFAGNVELGIKYLADSCQGGKYGSTQSTVLALRAIVAYDKARAHPTAAGKIQLFLDNNPVGDAIGFDQNSQGAIKLPDISEKLTPGKHNVSLKMSDGSSLPYAMAVTFNSVVPASSDQCKLTITTTLKDATVSEGAITEQDVVVTNKSNEIVPSPIAIIGLPGGLEVRYDQLKELVKAERIAAYEVRGREVILYWRDMQPNQKVEIPLSLTAAVPGTYTGPASRAYLYYTDEFKQWAGGTKVTITPKVGQ